MPLTRFNCILEGLHFALLLDENDSVIRRIVDGHAGRVVATVLQPLQAGHEELEDLLPALRRQVVQVRKDSCKVAEETQICNEFAKKTEGIEKTKTVSIVVTDLRHNPPPAESKL